MEQNTKAKKDSFSGEFGFILACIGSAVGLGNLWRFPVLISQFGGLTFFIPYTIFVVLVVYTGVISEYAMGRMTGKGPIGTFGETCKARGLEKTARRVGVIPVLTSLGLATGYAVIMGWVLYYLWLSITGQLMAYGQDIEALKANFNLAMGPGGCSLWIAIAGILCIVIMSTGVTEGIERCNRILLPALFGFLLVLSIYIAFLPGASEGYKYVFAWHPQELLNPRVWIYAFGQAFFSLSVFGSIGIIFGSYLPKGDNIPRSATFVGLFDMISALLATLVIIPAMATTGSQLSNGGPGLMFIYLAQVFNSMPGGAVVESLFYFCVAAAGITSMISVYEPFIALVKKKGNMTRDLAAAVVIACSCGAVIFFQHRAVTILDWLSNYAAPLSALLAAICFFWMLPKDKALKEVNDGALRKFGDGFYFTGRYVYCFLTLAALVLCIMLGGI